MWSRAVFHGKIQTFSELWKESLNSDCLQFHQYQERWRITPQTTEKKPQKTTKKIPETKQERLRYMAWNSVLFLRQVQTYDRVKPINRITQSTDFLKIDIFII